jgi:hypothetical protein
MNKRPRLLRLVALTVVVALPLLGLSGVASAKAAKKCHKTHSCSAGSGSGGSGGIGGAPPTILVTASPNPLVETGSSIIDAVLQVETSPSFAGDQVTISSSQLASTCATVDYNTVRTGVIYVQTTTNVTVVLDDDGNATVDMSGIDCAPGSSVIEADLDSAPYYTALTTLVANPPVVTTAGVTGYPNPEVETGDTTTGPNGASGDSDVYTVFEVETDPVYAEQTVEIDSAQLDASCGGGWDWSSPYGAQFAGIGINPGPEITAPLDDDGNAVFTFLGVSCAASTYEVIADVEAGDHPTYVTTYTVDPPAPTI